jgi:DNA-binding transcriptional regulator YiaG
MLPFGRIALKGWKTKLFSEHPVTLGEHLHKRRHELGLFQKDVARLLAANPHSITEWEKNHSQPGIRFWPAIIAFLGYDPHPEPRTLRERLRAKRRALGLSIAEAARWLGVDEGTFGKWERGTGVPIRRHTEVVTRFLHASLDAL